VVGRATHARCEEGKSQAQTLRSDPYNNPDMNGAAYPVSPDAGRIFPRPGGHGACPGWKPKGHAAVHERFSTPGPCAVRRDAPWKAPRGV